MGGSDSMMRPIWSEKTDPGGGTVSVFATDTCCPAHCCRRAASALRRSDPPCDGSRRAVPARASATVGAPELWYGWAVRRPIPARCLAASAITVRTSRAASTVGRSGRSSSTRHRQRTPPA
eukprot:scaffold21778_cov131-Isochrysis_galbana.AAC.8